MKGYHLVGLLMPAAWTAAALTFQATLDDATYKDVYDRFGSELSCTVAANRYVALSPSDLRPVESVKHRSGTGATPVAQGSAAVLTLVLKPYA